MNARMSDTQMREHLSQLAWDEYTRWRKEVERLRGALEEIASSCTSVLHAEQIARAALEASSGSRDRT